ncbi:cation channel sperm-associated auxiliary subunit beta isoform X8 [Equus przewalskii]|uniref:Cation channel sperm-associated auxiliary subunit beta isoform X8 n=1 Tax=Equus przewalskii TaxID=9798 RepID=A0ABM4MCZ7_EQUPR|nr:cation channel sperm-associated protein subunit beta isoform X7 [Equus caballus]
MELLLLCVIIFLLNVSDFSSAITYNKGDMEQSFACASQGFPQKNEIIKLYLSSDDLKIQCFFQSESVFTAKEFLSIFTSGGLAPSLGIINSTYSGIFHFNLTLFSDRVYWLINIPREHITKNTDVAAVEEWLVRITLQHGLNIYTTEGTLLDSVREPILQWHLGSVMTKNDVRKLYPHVVDLTVTKCPCANDVALLGFILNATLDGVYIGLSFSGFWNYDNTTWYNLTDMIYSQVGEEHTELSVVDMVLTNHFLVILTSLGLFISGDLRYPSSSVLTFSRADFCGFERVDYVKGKLWYNERCFANREHFEVDYVTITFERNRTLSEASSCFYSKEPFLEWLPCLPHISKGAKTIPSTVITFLVDQEHSSGIYLFQNQKQTSASVCLLKNSKLESKQRFPLFLFPSSFSSPVGMVFHPRSHFLYAYGNQVWLSIDGGNTFDFLADFHDDIIKNTYHSFYTSDIAFVSQSGNVYLTKAAPGIISSFQDSDIEKTVVIPGYSSFLITSILDDKNALAIATMPERVPTNRIFPKDSWFLYNFGQKNGRTWKIHSKPCNYWFQQHDDSLSLNVLKYIDLGKSHTFKVKLIPHTKGIQILEAPLLTVIVGSPTLLEVKAEGAFDDTDSYTLEISAASKGLRQGSTSLALIARGASTECFVTTMVPILKSSCSYLKSMHHVPSTSITLEHWISGIHKDKQGFNQIKTLPVNYRPPSNMGIAIPLTDNFYHADPSKPIPRNLFPKSKKSGKFKQCANVSTREECNCTQDQKLSHAVAFSDCREKVPRFKFPVTQYPISLEIHSEDGRIPLESPYLVTVTEVNERRNWKLKHTVPETVSKLKFYLEPILHAQVYNPSGLNLSIKGSELFHFRVSVVPGVTFCNLVEEFQIYVDEAPLPFPGHTLIAVAAAVMLGGLIFITFMFQLRNIHPWNVFRRLFRRNKVNFSNFNANQPTH